MKTEKVTILFAVLLTATLSYLSFQYLHFKNLSEAVRSKNFVLEMIESIDLKYNDLKFRFREEKKTTAPVALVAIDDDSVREVGRWPWGRDTISQISKNLTDAGASSFGFDVIFSEPERLAPEHDILLAKTVTENSDKIILGTFTEGELHFEPYQDYCLNEAFKVNGGESLVKLNPTVAFDDPEDPYDTLVWEGLFKQLFKNNQQQVELEYLNSVSKKSSAELSSYQKNYLELIKQRSIYEYCQVWLTDHDTFKVSDHPELKIQYLQIFKNHPELAKLDADKAIEQFKSEIYKDLIPQYIDWTPNIPSLQEAALYTASFNASLDADGYVRKYSLFYRTGNRLGLSYIPSLALQTYLISKKYRAEVQIERNGFDNGAKSIKSVKIFDTQTDPEKLVTDLPVDPMGRLTINYYGPKMALPYVSAKELLNNEPTMRVRQRQKDPTTGEYRILNPDGEVVNKKEFFKDRAAIIGATAEALYDLRNTPLEKNYPGPETHLSMLANLLDGQILKKVENENVILPVVLLILGLILSWWWAHTSALLSFTTFVGSLTVFALIDFYLFSRMNIMTTSSLLLTEIVVLYSWTTIFRYFTEERKKKELKSTFSKYVSPAVVDEILKEPENLKLGGRKQRMTVFFSDVRGFTTISERLSPTDLAKLLNDYLSPMTDLVFKNKGTLDKYMGDAIMAFFGAPIFYEDHAAHACRCALQSLEKLKELQAEFKRKNLPFIDIGIGINTGEMSVGNMGSNIVQNYTVMGDSVNLGSRLEGINKEYGTKIIISEFTYGDLKGQFVCREIDRVKVKGKNEPVKIFELIKEGTLDQAQGAWLKEFNTGYDLYFKQKFSDAQKYFKKSTELNAEDKVSELYIERCDEYLKDPPPTNWDGVFIMKTK